MLYASIRVQRSLRDFGEVARRINVGLVPILQKIPGFRGYYAIECGGGVGVSFCVFEDEKGARLSNERAAEWGKENLADISDGRPPETLAGRVLVFADR